MNVLGPQQNGSIPLKMKVLGSHGINVRKSFRETCHIRSSLFFHVFFFVNKNGEFFSNCTEPRPFKLQPFSTEPPSRHFDPPRFKRWIGEVLVQDFDSVNSADVLSKIPSANCHFGAEKFPRSAFTFLPFRKGCFF